MREWTPTSKQYPEPGQRVEWLDPNTGEVVQGDMRGRLWGTGGANVYYTPQFWRPIPK